MKTLLLILISFSAIAQDLTNKGLKLTELPGDYIYVVVVQGGFKQKLDAFIDFGQPEKEWDKIKNGEKDFIFNSQAHILNVMDRHGWEFKEHTTNYLNVGSGVTYHYFLFKKK